ncbi:hypothetical protein T492DRAFT_917542 [Pavlovales sp. CCMP2436]|nr:hypothetical protein T492DRAFT_917542 [Pavlovales sp. CCMP2436]
MTAKTGDEFALRCDEKVGLYGADQWMLFTTEAGGAPDAASAPLRDSVEARSPSPKRMKAAAGSARESDQPIPSSGATRPEASAYSTRALLTRAYAPPPKPPKPEGLDALARLVRDPAWALQSGKALHVDEKVVVAYDLYAKARLHLLLMPLHPSLKAVHAPTDLRSEHLPAIRELRKCAACTTDGTRLGGYHGRIEARHLRVQHSGVLILEPDSQLRARDVCLGLTHRVLAPDLDAHPTRREHDARARREEDAHARAMDERGEGDARERLQRFVFGFLIIHHFYQLPTSA